MNYAQFQQWVECAVDDLVRFGVPREEAESLMRSVEYGGIEAEARVRKERQFLLDFKQVGARGLAERKGCSPEAIRKHRRNLIDNKRLRPKLREQA